MVALIIGFVPAGTVLAAHHGTPGKDAECNGIAVVDDVLGADSCDVYCED